MGFFNWFKKHSEKECVNTIFTNSRLSLFKNAASPFLSEKERESYNKALSFDGGRITVTEKEIKVKTKNGKEFKSKLSHYESDMITETYISHFENGQEFRFLVASKSNPMAEIDPMVTFASVSRSGWAIHFNV